MKLLYVIHQFFPFAQSGTEQYCLAAAREARRRGDEVVVLSMHDDWGVEEPPVLVFDVPYDGFRVRRLRHWLGLNPNEVLRDYRNPAVAAAFAQVLREERPDAVHFFHLRKLGGDLLAVAKRTGAPVVVSLTDFWYLCPRFTLLRADGSLCDGPPAGSHGCAFCAAPELLAEPVPPADAAVVGDASPPSQLAALLRRKDWLLQQLALADSVLAPSQFLARMFVHNGLPPSRLCVLPYGLDQGRVARRPVPRPRTPLRVGFAGVFSPWKGAAVLIEAVRSLPGPLELSLWGNDQETMFLDNIAALKRSAGDDPRIRFAGAFGREQIDEVYASMDVLVVPSVWYENTPFVILEAFEAGVPVIASDLGGMSEVVQDGRNGFHFPAGDSAALAAILAACRDDPERLRSLRPAPPGTIRDNYEVFAACYRRQPPPAVPPLDPPTAAAPREPRWFALLLPLVWLLALLLAAATLLLDLLCLPWIWWRRRHRRADAAPPCRNASVVVLNWNGIDFLKELLPSLQVAVARCPGDHEVIVVDNGSDDGSADFCAREHGWVRVVRVPENRFFIRGNLEGSKVATRDILVFLNNDMRVEPDFLVELLAPFGPPDLFAVTARIDMQGHRQETGCTRMHEKRGELRLLQVDGQDEGLVPAQWAGGGSSAFDRAKYEALGGFEVLYDPCYVEDVSLSYLAWKRGWRVLFAGRSVVHHAFRGTSSKVFGHRRVEALDRRNRELFFWRAVTDPGLVLLHAAMLPWHLLKAAKTTGLALQLAALLRALPRLPRALLLRQAARARQRRTDREVLALANNVQAHRRAVRGAWPGPLRLLSLAVGGSAPASSEEVVVLPHALPPPAADQRPIEDLFGLIPRRLWPSAGDGPRREGARHLLREHDHDAVFCCDLDSYAAAAPFLSGAVIVHLDGFAPATAGLEPRRERRFFAQLASQAAAISCADADTASALQPLLGRAPTVLDRRDPAAVAALLRAVLGAR